jgi:3-oxoacyl-[acyl-carrier protein] reductase
MSEDPSLIVGVVANFCCSTTEEETNDQAKERNMRDLKGKVAIVTGAGQGIGRATALELAKEGAAVAVCGRGDNIEEVRREIDALGREAFAVRIDVSKWVDAERMAKAVSEKFGHIDILVNNAGISIKRKDGTRLGILEVSESDFDAMLNTNLKGVFNCCKAVIPFMMKQRSGRIVNLGSTTALTGDVSAAPYVASKAGIMSMTKSLARELGPYNIYVNSVSPGMVQTNMHRLTPKAALEKAQSSATLGRIAEPFDVARLILHLVSDDYFVTGQTVVIDGGKTMY